ncbi:putative nucleotidyltransferase, ribonuclease H [Tanacetum coccineum]
MPKWGDLRRAILKECHDSKWAGHPGITRMFPLVKGTYYWPRMGEDVETFVRTLLICQQDKIEQKKSGGLLEPLPMPKGPWESYGTFIAAPPDVTADDMAKLFFKNVIIGTDLNFSTSFHPQMDGQTKRVNALLELYLWHYVSSNQHDWAKLFDVAQFSYNMQRSEATRKSPFELVTGRQPLTPNALAASYEGSSPDAYKTMKEWHEQAYLAQASLDKAAKRMKKWADEKRRHVEFEVGDQVMVKLLPQQFKSLRKVHKGLIRRYKGPFSVIGRVGKQVGKRKTYCGSLRTRSKDITRMTRRARHELRRLSGILWKVEEGLGSSWKPLEALGRPRSFL